jgi:hypothetical protein
LNNYYSFIDWFKCIGITLIVVGHVASAPFNHLTAPIYPKQLGVALFIFAMGFSLAQEKRPVINVLVRRLFELYFWGILCALLLSIIIYTKYGSINKSNYSPFIAGINIAFNFFPANPTTWFIGTYLHILLLWSLIFRRIRITLLIVTLTIAVEILLRAFLFSFAGRFIAYMAFPNWLGVYIVGAYLAHSNVTNKRRDIIIGMLCLPLLLIFPVLWPRIAGPYILDHNFPFASFGIRHSLIDPLCTSFLVSVWYLFISALLYFIVRTWRIFHIIRFVAGNTVLVFIVHMPLYYALEGPLMRFHMHYALRSLFYIIFCLPLLTLFSYYMHRLLPIRSLRDRIEIYLCNSIYHILII